MPTGYTAGVENGTVTEFKDFALQCARAFGALVTMRDDSPGVPTPRRLEPSKYLHDSLESARKRLAELDAMSAEDAANQACIAYHNEVNRRKAAIRDWEVEQARYAAMLEKVHAWQPPTPDHVEMKEFMVQQLSLDAGARSPVEYWREPVRKTGKEWLSDERAHAMDRLKGAEDDWQKELERTASRNVWLTALWDSLEAEPVAA